MKKKYPKIPVCCTPVTCFKLTILIPFIPFIKIREDSYCVPMITELFLDIKKHYSKKDTPLMKYLLISIL